MTNYKLNIFYFMHFYFVDIIQESLKLLSFERDNYSTIRACNTTYLIFYCGTNTDVPLYKYLYSMVQCLLIPLAAKSSPMKIAHLVDECNVFNSDPT